MTRLNLIATLLLATAAAGCGDSGGAAHNKSGADVATKRHVLHLEATDAGSPDVRYFAKRIQTRSGGSLRVDVRDDYPSILPANEARLARDVRAGRVDFGVLPARAWPAAGVGAFAALQAPFVLASYTAARSALAGPAGDSLRRALERAGIVPLALVPDELRRLLTVRPLDTPEAFRGLRVRVADNSTSRDDLQALGAEPVQGITSDQVYDQLKARHLDGAETAPMFGVANGYGRFAKHVTGYALFDRVDTLVASPAAWKRLSPSQQSAVRAAARDTIGFAASLPDRDTKDLGRLCASGVRVTTPTVARLRAIADATEPVRAALRRDPAAGPILKQLEATEGTGPQLLPVPRKCEEAGRPAGGGQPTGTASIPNGIYVTRTTVADLRRVGQLGPDWETSMTWTTRMRDGRWTQNRTPLAIDPKYKDGWWGTYTASGDRLTFRYLNPEDAGTTETVRWSYYDGRLTFKLIDVADLSARAIYAAHPWRKVR
jgi:TRAP-type C4-dicarboxylate transport system substrate-binding protein